MSEALDSDVNEDSGTVRKPLSGTLIFNESLNSNSIDDLRPSHPGCDTLHVRVVARKHPQIEDCCNSTSLNVGNNFVFKTPRHHRYATLMHEQWHVNIHRVREAVIAPY